MTFAEVIHFLVDNCQGLATPAKIDAHKAVADQFGETDRHYLVPSPEAEQTTADEKAAKVAELRAQLAALDEPAEPAKAAEPEPVAEVPADQRAAGDPAE